MQNFEDTFETRKRSFLSAFLICMTVPLKSPKSFVTIFLTFARWGSSRKILLALAWL